MGLHDFLVLLKKCSKGKKCAQRPHVDRLKESLHFDFSIPNSVFGAEREKAGRQNKFESSQELHACQICPAGDPPSPDQHTRHALWSARFLIPPISCSLRHKQAFPPRP